MYANLRRHAIFFELRISGVEHGDVIKGGFASIILPKPPKLYRTEGKA
jgi:hypothetical protein